MKIVISLGGSILDDGKKIQEFADVFEKISRDHKLFIVVGGGKVARKYISTARELGADETFCDHIGIAVTRINAMLLIAALKSAPRKIPEEFVTAYELSKTYPIVVMGGTFPGHTTDATAALLAEFVNADLFLNATSVDGVYSDDPKVNRNAIKYSKLSPSELVSIINKAAMRAGVNVVMDLLAAKIIERSKIRTVVFLGEPENILKIINGERIGTLIE